MLSSDVDSDAELQDAFEKGQLNPGTYVSEDAPKKFVYNKTALDGAFQTLKSKRSDFMFPEYLDASAPNISLDADQDEYDFKNPPLNTLKKNEMAKQQENLAKNDFQRETYFYNLAQTSAYNLISQLNKIMKTQRPDDYFAEMVKSDQHMDRIKRILAAKQASLQRIEKVTKERKERSLSKKMAKLDKAKKQAELRKKLTKTKLWKKKINVDNLDEELSTSQPGNKKKKFGQKDDFKNRTLNIPGNKKLSKKAQYKLKKFGNKDHVTEGGFKRKRGWKRNNMKKDDLIAYTSKNTNNNKNRPGAKNQHKNFGNRKGQNMPKKNNNNNKKFDGQRKKRRQK